MIELHDLSRSFGSVQAVQGITTSVTAGITALLGPNGAGKTTLLNLIAGLDLPAAGSVSVSGLDPYRQHRACALQMGVLPSQDGLLNHLGAHVQLSQYARLFGLTGSQADKRAWQCLEAVKLDHIDRRPVSEYSTGMRKRLAIARTLLHNPQIMLLDEPTSGLDPAQVMTLRRLLQRFREEGRLILFNTHHLSEVAMADYIMVMCEGQLLFHDTRDAFLSLSQGTANQLERMEQAYAQIIQS